MYRPRTWTLPTGERLRIIWGPSVNRRLGLPTEEIARVIDRMYDDSLGRRQLFDMLREQQVAPPHAPRDARNQVEILKGMFRRGELVGLRAKPGQLKPMQGPLELPRVDEDTAPPLGPPEDAETQTWFSLTVIDEMGRPLDGLELELSADRPRKLRTNGAGNVRIDDAHGSFSTARFVDVAAVREKLRSRKIPPADAPLPDGPNVKIEIVRSKIAAVQLESEQPLVLVLRREHVRVRMVGMYFETNKSFLLPSAMHGIRGAVLVFERNPDAKLLVVGHTDTVADEKYNLDLSLERADAVAAYFTDDVDAWLPWFADSQPEKKRWGPRELQYMLSALPEAQPPFYEGKPTGKEDAKHHDAVAAFQQWSNVERGSALTVDGKAGPETRRALVAAYMALQGTSLPDGKRPSTFGCGEYFPAHPTGDNVEDEENRRVEVFYFDGEIDPPPPGKKAKKGSTEYPQWDKQVLETIDFQHGGLTVRVVDDDDVTLAGADVRISGPHTDAGVTAEDGTVHFFDLPDGEYLVEASMPGCRPRRRTVRVPFLAIEEDDDAGAAGGSEALAGSGGGSAAPGPPGAPGEPVATLKLSKVIDVVVTVRDASGAPIDGAEVTVTAAEGVTVSGGGKQKTDETGRAAFEAFRAKKTKPGESPIDKKTLGLNFSASAGSIFEKSSKPVVDFEDQDVRYVFFTLDAGSFKPKHRFLWQNKILRGSIFPFRDERLRDGLVKYKTFDLDDPANIDPDVLAERKALRAKKDLEISAQETVIAAKKKEIADLATAAGKTAKTPDEIAKKKEASKRLHEAQNELTEEEKKLAELKKERALLDETNTAAATDFALASYTAKVDAMGHRALIEEWLRRFEKDVDGTTHPKWVRYMVVHFCGMRYKSAHCSFAPPLALLASIRNEEHDLDVKGVSLVRLREFAKEAHHVSVDRGYVVDKKHPKPTDPKADANLTVTELETNPIALARVRTTVIEFRHRRDGDDMKPLTEPQALAILKSRDPDGEASAHRAFPLLPWRAIVSLTQLRNDTTTANWELTDTEIANINYDPPKKKEDPPPPPPPPVVRGLRKIASGGTMWKQHHRQTLEPNVTRAVCNQVDEIALQSRAIPESVLRSAGGLTDNAIDYAKNGEGAVGKTGGLRQIDSIADVEEGGSFFFLEWKPAIPADPKEEHPEWRQNRWSTVNPNTAVAFDRGDNHRTLTFGKTILPGTKGPIVYQAPVSADAPGFDYSYTVQLFEGLARDPDDHKMLATFHDEWPEWIRTIRNYDPPKSVPTTPQDTHPPGSPHVIDESVLVWTHEAAIAKVRKSDGLLKRVMTFETRTHGAGLLIRLIEVGHQTREGLHFKTYTGQLPQQQPNNDRLDAFLDGKALLDACDPD